MLWGVFWVKLCRLASAADPVFVSLFAHCPLSYEHGYEKSSFLFVILLAAYTNEEQALDSSAAVILTETPAPMPTPQPHFRIIAYVTGAIVPDVIPYERLTPISGAFLAMGGN